MKKILLIFAIVMFLSSLILYFFFSGNSEKTVPDPGDNSSNQNTFPTAPQKISDEEIKTQFEKHANAAAEQTLSRTEIKYSSGQTVPLFDLAAPLSFRINPKVIEVLSQNDYQFFSCGKNFGIKIVAGNTQNIQRTKDLWEDEVRFRMSLWEPTLFSDLHAVLFPDATFSSQELAQPQEFKDGVFRYAEIKLPNGEKSSINYTVNNDYIFIATSSECLEKAADNIFQE